MVIVQYLVIMQSGKPKQDVRAELCSICREPCTRLFFGQGQVPVLRDPLQTRSGREREAPLRKVVLHLCGAQ